MGKPTCLGLRLPEPLSDGERKTVTSMAEHPGVDETTRVVLQDALGGQPGAIRAIRIAIAAQKSVASNTNGYHLGWSLARESDLPDEVLESPGLQVPVEVGPSDKGRN